MAAGTLDGLGFERSPREAISPPTSKRSSTEVGPVRFNINATEDKGETAGTGSRDQRSPSLGRQSVQNANIVATEHSGRDITPTSPRKPTALLGADGKPLPILKGNRQFGYAQARRLAEHLRVKFAVDRNETRFYCPDSNEHTEPPPAPAELRLAVRGFLKSSKKVLQESQEVSQAAECQLLESKEIEEQLVAMTQEYVTNLELRKEQQKLKAAQQTVIVTQAVQPQRCGLCCGRSQLVLP